MSESDANADSRLEKQQDRLDKKSKEAEVLDEDELEGDEDSPPPIKTMRQFMSFMGVSRSSGGSLFHPIFDKFNDDHVDTFLAQSHEEDMARLRAVSRGPIFGLLYAVLVAILLVFLVVYLAPENRELLAEILKLAIVFAGGVGGGYGLRAHQQSRRNR